MRTWNFEEQSNRFKTICDDISHIKKLALKTLVKQLNDKAAAEQ